MERVKTLYESPKNRGRQFFIYQDALWPESVIVVRTNGDGKKATTMLISKKAILAAAKQLEEDVITSLK